MVKGPLEIVGGGLAGLTLALGLRQRGVPVCVYEAGSYPRHRVCGEFISGLGLGVLERLGLMSQLMDAGARPAVSACLFANSWAGPVRALPEPALCLSRHLLDGLLAESSRRAGAELRERSRWQSSYEVPGVVRATGRRAQAQERGRRLLGLKIHATGIQLEADLELHLTPQGYVGLCQLAHGVVNVCGLFWSRTPIPDLAGRELEFLQGRPGSRLRARFRDATFSPETLTSVAGLALARQPSTPSLECRVGDALTMIPPFTGNGMSMAFESAWLGLDPLDRYYRGTLTWTTARLAVATACDAAFSRRVLYSGLLQRLLFQPVLRHAVVGLAPAMDWTWRWCFALTR